MRRTTASLLAVFGVAAVLVFVLLFLDETPTGSTPAGTPTDLRGRSQVMSPPAAFPSDAVPQGVSTEPTRLVDAGQSPVVDALPVQEAADEPLASLRGRVVDPDRTPLAGVAVTYMPSRRQTAQWPLAGTRDIDLSILPTTRTGSDGRFDFHIPWSGPPAGQQWNDAPDLILDLDGFALRAVACAGMSAAGLDLGDVLLEQGDVLLGRVIDERLRPVPGVPVGIIARAPEPVHIPTTYRGSLDVFLYVTTDAMGRFVSRGLLPGRVGYEVIVPGYMPVFEAGLRMTSGTRLDVGDIQLARGGELEGQVLDTAGVGVPGALVHATDRVGRTAFIGFDPGDSLGWELEDARDRCGDRSRACGCRADRRAGGFPGRTGAACRVHGPRRVSRVRRGHGREPPAGPRAGLRYRHALHAGSRATGDAGGHLWSAPGGHDPGRPGEYGWSADRGYDSVGPQRRQSAREGREPDHVADAGRSRAGPSVAARARRDAERRERSVPFRGPHAGFVGAGRRCRWPRASAAGRSAGADDRQAEGR